MTEAELLALISQTGLVSAATGSIAHVDDLPDAAIRNRGAVEELLQRHYVWLSRLCLMEFRDPVDALDCLQEVMLEIAKSLENFDGRSELRTWMFVVAKRTVYRMRLRAKKRLERFPLGDAADAGEDVPADVIGKQKTSEELILEMEEHRQMLALVRELPEKQRWAVFFHYFENLSLEETAERLGCSVGAVKTHLFRGRKSLKVRLEEQNNEAH